MVLIILFGADIVIQSNPKVCHPCLVLPEELVVRMEADLEYFLGRVSGAGLSVLEVRRSKHSTLFFDSA